jgi:hypothetical protein
LSSIPTKRKKGEKEEGKEGGREGRKKRKCDVYIKWSIIYP